MSGNYPFVDNFLIEFRRTFALDHSGISMRISTTTYFFKKRCTFYEETNKIQKKSSQNTCFHCSKKRIQVQGSMRPRYNVRPPPGSLKNEACVVCELLLYSMCLSNSYGARIHFLHESTSSCKTKYLPSSCFMA